MSAVHSSLMGRWASGTWHERNSKYVPEWDRKRKVKYTGEQDEFWIAHDVVGQVVAVTIEHDGWVEHLILWVLVDGKARALHRSAVVMPSDWVPEIPR